MKIHNRDEKEKRHHMIRGEERQMPSEKAKAFVERILAECEQESLTIADVIAVTVLFNSAVNNRIDALNSENKFRNS